MDKDSKGSSGSIPTTGMIWVALFAAGAFFAHEVPWQGSRPNDGEPKPYPYVARQDVDARLWQDPLGAITRGRDDVRKQYPGISGPAPSDGSVSPRTEKEEHGPEALVADIGDRSCQSGVAPLIVPIMIPGGSYPGLVESRRRDRYAALAAFNELGYAPDDPEHLGYLMPGPRTATGGMTMPEFIAYEWLSPARSGVEEAGSPQALVLWLDEDVFGKEPLAHFDALTKMLGTAACAAGPGRAAHAVTPRFVVIGPSYTSTLQEMLKAAVLERRSGATPPKRPRFYAYGATSDNASILQSQGFDTAKTTLPILFGSDGLEVFRTIGQDRDLTVSLHGELIKRGVDPARHANCYNEPAKEAGVQHVILIAEWDTFYGRALPDLMMEQFRDGGCSAKAVRRYVHRYSYMRGLDGQLPTVGKSAAPATTSSTAAAAPGDAGRPTDKSNRERQIERPEGQSQLDYLRRLSVDLATLDQTLQREGHGSIVTIGVLGTDVFDKMLILQALRPQFQNAIFFTTDLDAEMLHPKERDWAKNLVVASSFGLQLHPSVQRDTLPFRDSYQTSVYLSTQIALYNALDLCNATLDGRGPCIGQNTLDQWLAHPRVFEVGRDLAFDFGATREVLCDDVDDWTTCDSIHPPGTRRFRSLRGNAFRNGILLVIAGLVILGITTGVGRRVKAWKLGVRLRRAILRVRLGKGLGRIASGRWLANAGPASWIMRARFSQPLIDLRFGRWLQHTHPSWWVSGQQKPSSRLRNCVADWLIRLTPWSLVMFAIGVVTIVLLTFSGQWLWERFAGYLTQGDDGEPISFIDGISVWPTELLRLVSFVLSVAFGIWAWVLLNRNLIEIARELRFRPTQKRMMADVRSDVRNWTWCDRIVGILSFRLGEYQGKSMTRKIGLTPRAQWFWKKYLYKGMGLSRSIRVVGAVVLYAIVASAVVAYFGVPGTPYRGEVSKAWNAAVLLLSVGSMLFIIFFVVDATVFSHQIIKALKKEIDKRYADGGGTIWASSTVAHYQKKFEIKDPYQLDAWVLMDFISLRTKVVAKLIYLPFIAISLMVLSRSQLFDNWTMPVGLVLVFASSVAIIMGCAILLRESAESVRDDVLRRLTEELVRVKGIGGASGQIETLIAEIRSLRKGAFAPYTQQPLFRALLLPLSTFGGSALLDYMTMYSF
ncbi:MAG: hypothetical protein ABI277_00490 [Burkholderiaceae bacterium]